MDPAILFTWIIVSVVCSCALLVEAALFTVRPRRSWLAIVHRIFCAVAVVVGVWSLMVAWNAFQAYTLLYQILETIRIAPGFYPHLVAIYRQPMQALQFQVPIALTTFIALLIVHISKKALSRSVTPDREAQKAARNRQDAALIARYMYI